MAGLLALLALVCPLPGAAAQAAEEGARGYSLHDTEAARAKQREADQHLAAGRWWEGIELLQELIEKHDGDVLGETRPPVPGPQDVRSGDRVSQQPVFAGAADFATGRLFELDERARDLYRRRYEEPAALALEAALARGSARALVRVARRWPITEQAERAWWALGDLELEHGNFVDGMRAWSRALSLGLADRRLDLARPVELALKRSDASALEGATRSWTDAVERLLERRSESDARGLRARVAFLLARLARPARGVPEAAREASAMRPSDYALSLPGNHAEAWRDPYSLPASPYDVTSRSRSRAGRDFVLFPARWGDWIYLTTSLEVIALKAFTGEVAWESGEPDEWDDVLPHLRDSILSQVQASDCLVAPAVARGVVVAPLQIPFVFEPQITFGDMQITRELPNRRLFAFDARSGRPLWDTRPPPNWDGESGDVAQRARIVGPPVIEGSRVLVPLARLRGRIEYFAGCFDLFSGELQWASSLVSGQRELNMFGRMDREFCAPPLVVAGARVLALTQLGTLACLDLFTGDVLWEVSYDTIKIRKNVDFDTNLLNPVWQNAPPSVVGDVVLATPFDSRDLIAVDLASGAMVWSLGHSTLMQIGLGSQRGRNGELRLLVGADEDRVYLFGHRLVALGSATGPITRNRVDQVRWVFPPGLDHETELDPDGPRPVLDGERIHVPDEVLYSVDRVSGRLRGKMDWLYGARGNLLLSEGVLLSLTRRRLAAYFEWEELVEEARRRQRAAPQDVRPALHLAGLLRSRGVSVSSRDDEGRATRYLDEARAVLEPFVEPAGARPGAASDARAAEELHHVLRSEARVLRDLARRSRALELLGRARELAPGAEELRDTLLEELALLRSREPGAYAERLSLLLESCGDLPLHLDISADERVELADRLVPVVASESQEEPSFALTTVGLWVLVQRASLAARAAASAAEFADLHTILERFPEARLGRERASDWASARIGARLAAGERQGYETFEGRAQDLLERALEERSALVLESVGRLYPHSTAATAANEARIDLAVRSGDVEATAAILQAELSPAWALPRASERELTHLAKLAHVLGESGCARARAALFEVLAREHGGFVCELPERGASSLAELAALHRMPPPAQIPEPSFDPSVRLRSALAGRYRPLCTIPPASPTAPDAPQEVAVQVFVAEDQLVGFALDAPETPLWRTAITRGEIGMRMEERVVVVPGRVILAGGDRVFAVDAVQGHVAWSRPLAGATLMELSESNGVLVLSLSQRNPWSTTREFESVAVGLETHGGRELWRLAVPAHGAGGRVLAEGGRLILFLGRNPERIELRDLFTSRPIAECAVEPLADTTLSAAFVASGRLILPRFQAGSNPGLNHVLGLDLDSGRPAWRIDIGEGRRDGAELWLVVRSGEDVFLVLRGERKGSISAAGAVYQLSPRIGAISSRPIATLEPGDEIIGRANSACMRVDAPYLFVLAKTPREDRSALRAIHLPHGQRWVTELPYSFEAYSSRVSPAVSSTTVALSWRVARRSEERENRWHTDLLLLDRATGAARDRRTLPDKLDQIEVGLTAFSDALFVCGNKEMETLR